MVAQGTFRAFRSLQRPLKSLLGPSRAFKGLQGASQGPSRGLSRTFPGPFQCLQGPFRALKISKFVQGLKGPSRAYKESSRALYDLQGPSRSFPGPSRTFKGLPGLSGAFKESSRPPPVNTLTNEVPRGAPSIKFVTNRVPRGGLSCQKP